MSRADISAGKAHVELYVKNSKFVKGLNQASKQLTSFGRDIASIGLSMQAAGAAALVPLAATVKFSSDMEEQMNKFNVVFGESSAVMRKWADDTGEALGRSQTQMVTFLASVQDLLVPMGFGADQASELAKQISVLAVDLASFNNMADADVMRDLQAAITGSGEVMKKYGVIVNETAVKQQLLNEGLDPTAATNQQKAMARLTIILEGTKAAQGDAERSSGSFANMMKRLQADITNAAVAIGDAFLPMLRGIMPRVREILKGIVDWVSKNKLLFQTIGLLSGALFTLGTVFTTTGFTIIAFGKALAGVTFLVTALTKGITLLAGSFYLLGTPLGLITIGLTALTIGFFTATDSGQKAAKELVGAFEAIAATWKRTMGGLVAALESGDFQLAASIAAQGVKVVFLTVFAEIEIAFREMMTEMLKGIANLPVEALAKAGGPKWARVIRGLQDQAFAGFEAENEDVAARRRKGVAKAGKGLFKLTEQPKQQQAMEARRAEIEAVRDQTSRMSDPTAVVMAQYAAERARRAAMSRTIGGSMGGAGTPEMQEMLRVQQQQLAEQRKMLNELRLGRAVFE